MSPVYLDAVSALTARGLQCNASVSPWEADQSGPADVRRQQVLSVPYPAFGKLTQADRIAFSAACLLFSHYPECTGEGVGVTMAVPFGSLSTDLRYQETLKAVPSPALFSATLPSSPVSEIAIHFKLKGPNRVFAHDRAPGLCCLHAAFRLIGLRKAETVLAVLVGGLEAADWRTPFVEEAAAVSPHAYALLFTARPRPDGLRYKASLTMSMSSKRPLRGSETGLFDGIMSAAQRGGDATLDFDIANCTGTFDIAKER